MNRLRNLNPANAQGKTKQLFDGIQGKLGTIPNMMKTMGNSPAVLEGYLNLSGALSSGSLSNKVGELIALTVSEANGCEYCKSAHAFIGEKMVKIPTTELYDAIEGRSSDQKTQAILDFAKTLVTKRGKVDNDDVQNIKDAGLNDGEIGEIVAHVALNTFTNYFNNTANTEIDFPVLQNA